MLDGKATTHEQLEHGVLSPSALPPHHKRRRSEVAQCRGEGMVVLGLIKTVHAEHEVGVPHSRRQLATAPLQLTNVDSLGPVSGSRVTTG